MNEDQFPASLQESLLTLISYFDEDKSKLVASLVTPDLFEEPYRGIATKVLEYRTRFNTCPGEAHIDDLFAYVIDDPMNKLGPRYKQLLLGMHYQAGNGFNLQYVSSSVFEFIRRQTLKAGVLRAAQRYQQGGDNVTNDVERILLDTVKTKVDVEDPGTFLGDKKKSLKFLDGNDSEYCPLGIKELDYRGVCPTRKEVMLFIAPRKKGKSFFAIHVGRRALMHRWPTVHISLEMSEERVIQRYFQNFFGIAKRDESFIRTVFEFDELRRLSGFNVEKVKPVLNLQDPAIRKKLNAKLDEWGLKLDNLLVKHFPSNTLTIQKLEAYLDSIEIAHKFTPSILIIDYPALMKLGSDNYTRELGQLVVSIRGIVDKRNMAGVIFAQGTRETDTSKRVDSNQIAGDISMVNTSDSVLTYSQTEAEHRLNLARLYVSNLRNDEDRFTVLISQSYATGQFVVASAPMIMKYWDHLKEQVGELENESEEE